MVGVFKKRGNFAARIVAAALAAVLCISSVPCAAFAQVVSDADVQSASGTASQEARVVEEAGEDVGSAGAVFDVGVEKGAGTAGIGARSNGEAATGAASVQVVLRPVAQMATVRARVQAMLPHLRHRRNASR